MSPSRETRMPLTPPVRPDLQLQATSASAGSTPHAGVRVAARIKRMLRNALAQRLLLLTGLAALWEAAARVAGNDLLLPGFFQTAAALWSGVVSGDLLVATATSLLVLGQGFALGVVAALLLTFVAVSSKPGRELLETLTAMFNPLPAIALLPLALLWFGLGRASLLFVLVHSVVWPLALATHSGFRAAPETLRMAGRNYGLSGARLLWQVLIPAALPAILAGLKSGWAFAWRTLIAAELVFGASSGKGGLGWLIFQNRNELYTDKVFAGLAMVILIGLLVENLLFRNLERVTVLRWGMQR